MNYIMNLDYDVGWRLLYKIVEAKEESRAHDIYASIYPHFKEDTYLTFDEFYGNRNSKICTLPTEQILKETNAIKAKYGW